MTNILLVFVPVFTWFTQIACAGGTLEKIDAQSDLSFYREALTTSTVNLERLTARSSTRCWCQGGCFFGSGDSYHFRKVVDVDCALAEKAKKDKVVKELMSHFVDSHGVSAIPSILENVAVKCFQTTTTR